jgi:hypothetical protein
MLPQVALIVLCYNGVDLNLDCLAFLRRSDYANAEVIVVDHGPEQSIANGETVTTSPPCVALADAPAHAVWAQGRPRIRYNDGQYRRGLVAHPNYPYPL